MNESSLSQNTTGEDGVEYWALSLMVLPVVTVFGNVLVCLSVYSDRNLHTVTNYFIVSLAIADILVGILVMPLAVYVEVSKKTDRPTDSHSLPFGFLPCCVDAIS